MTLRTPLATLALALSATLLAPIPSAQAAPALPALDVPAYMGRWHQVALYPNRFQAQCLDSTTATYKLLDDGRVEVANRCRTKDGWDETVGVARPREGTVRQDGGRLLAPAALEGSFLPKALRWLGVGWGKYDVVHLSAGAPQSGWAIVSEPTKQYLWVLSRTPQLDEAQWGLVKAELQRMGFDMQRLRREAPPRE